MSGANPKPAETRFERRLARKRRDNDFLYAQLIGAISDQLNNALQEGNFSRADLAKKLGVSRAYISRVMNEHKNLTIKSLIIVSNALNRRVLLQLVPFEDTGTFSIPVDDAEVDIINDHVIQADAPGIIFKAIPWSN